MFKGNILIIAKEAGAAAYLAALMRKAKTERITIYAYPKAAEVFFRQQIPFIVIEERLSAAAIIQSLKPDLIYVSLSVGPTFEKRVLSEGLKREIPVHVFIDSYLNLWQRFANHRGNQKWHYLPNRIYVIDSKTKTRIIQQGAPGKIVRILPHPLITKERHKARRPKISRQQLCNKIDVPVKAGLILFVSEYRFRDSKIWKWDQPAPGDLESLLRVTVRAAHLLTKKFNFPTFVLIKKHPVEVTNIQRRLSLQERKFCKTVNDFDKDSLINAADVITGLTSILLSEAASQGKIVFSYHRGISDRSVWFSTINSNVLEMTSEKDCITLIIKSVLKNKRGAQHS